MNKEAEKFMKTIKTIMTIFAIVFFAAIILTIAQGFFEVEIIDTTIFFIIAPIFVIGFTIFVIVKAFKGGKKYREELMTTKVPRRIKYVDTFYYYKSYYQGTDDSSTIQHYIYHIFEDNSSKQLYALSDYNTNLRLEQILGNTKVLRIDSIKKFTTRKDWKEANYGDEGNIWIDEELNDIYHREDDKAIFTYGKEKHDVKFKTELYHRNEQYDYSVLDKVKFITGYAELDKKE